MDASPTEMLGLGPGAALPEGGDGGSGGSGGAGRTVAYKRRGEAAPTSAIPSAPPPPGATVSFRPSAASGAASGTVPLSMAEKVEHEVARTVMFKARKKFG
jgi:hypothetical protein